MKKSILIFLILTLASSVLFATAGDRGKKDVIKGKSLGDTLVCGDAKYVLATFDGLEDCILVLRNIENKDTSSVLEPPTEVNSWGQMDESVEKIVREQFTKEELEKIKRSCPDCSIIIRCLMKADGRVSELIFYTLYDKNKKYQTPRQKFWFNLPVCRFREIEKAIMAGVNESGREWTSPENLERPLEGSSVSVLVDLCEYEGNDENIESN